MRIINSLLVVILICLLSNSCVERFYLNKEDDFNPKLVIEGTFTNEDGEQEIVISNLSSPESPRFFPVSGCMVAIEDDKGHTFSMPESVEPGHYRGLVNDSYIIIGARYRLLVKTSKGIQYESSFEELLPCPPVNSVYYELETKQTSDPKVNIDGIQFFTDFQGDDTYGRFYRWKLEETFEYHSTWPVSMYLDENDTLQIIVPDDYSDFICYKSEKIGDIFTLSTNGFSQNSYMKYPFHFVNNQTQRLMNHYCLMVKQYSLSESAYNFWENLRKNNQESEDLFGKQPANVKSNIYNKNDSSEVVLGYFGVSAVSSKRIHVYRVPGISFGQVKFCQTINSSSDPDSMPKSRPLYFAPMINDDGSITWVWAETSCFICTTMGGTTEKPSYWNEE